MNVESTWTVYRTRFLVHARQLTEPLLFTDALGREHSGLPGDYLVESSSGFRRITPRAIFEDVYVPLAPAQPQDAQATQSAIERALRVLDNPWLAGPLRPSQTTITTPAPTAKSRPGADEPVTTATQHEMASHGFT